MRECHRVNVQSRSEGDYIIRGICVGIMIEHGVLSATEMYLGQSDFLMETCGMAAVVVCLSATMLDGISVLCPSSEGITFERHECQ